MSERVPELDAINAKLPESLGHAYTTLHLAEVETYGVTPNMFTLSRATGKRMTVMPRGTSMLLSVYNGDEWQHLTLEAAQIEALRDWLQFMCEHNVDLRLALDMLAETADA